MIQNLENPRNLWPEVVHSSSFSVNHHPEARAQLKIPAKSSFRERERERGKEILSNVHYSQKRIVGPDGINFTRMAGRGSAPKY
jgi:hypothetical protein